LPGGFPATEAAWSCAILRRLFTPEDAELAMCLTLLAEEPRVIAHRRRISWKRPSAVGGDGKKGLIYAIHTPGKPPQYMAQHFVVGIWEFQVNRLSPEFVHEFDDTT